MIPVKLAVAKAVEFAEAMLGASNILLEEVDLGKDGPNDVWMVTLSFPGRSDWRPLAAGNTRRLVCAATPAR